MVSQRSSTCASSAAEPAGARNSSGELTSDELRYISALGTNIQYANRRVDVQAGLPERVSSRGETAPVIDGKLTASCRSEINLMRSRGAALSAASSVA
ncbi:hypothetical protein SKAU_G00202970 [Synaphobranchus kaupii]|uniref:Uncharacterized protein n=1 Tax=Synaphobranchus kaupii TaxID=118154 RepID=A0A9Q1IYE2_SYNKA|nr:hypothetical protein SKAU_G00202970 [Synaphobranchus kaupii]